MRTTMMRWLRGGLAGLAMLGLLAGCGGGEDPTKAKLRLVNASSGYAALNLVVDDDTRQSSVAYGGAEGYVDIDPKHTDTELRASGSSTALATLTPALTKNRHYTVLAYGRVGALQALLLDENTDTPDSGKTRLRIVNAAPEAGALDVYVTDTGDTLASATALQAGATAGTVNAAATVNAGTRRLRVTGAGSKTDLRLDLSTLALPSERAATLVLTPGAGGVLVNALLINEQGGITRLDTAQARVRVAAAVADGGSVAASVGGTALMNGVGAPAVGLYTLVAAGTVTPVVAVNGGAVATAPVTLAAGADYTLMVYGAAATPAAVWLDDDNRPPSDASRAKLRLVHGVGDITTPLSLSVDFVPVADSVAPGTASAYDETLAPTSTAAWSVTTPGQATAVVSAVDQVFAAGGSYTLFVVGARAAPTGILRKDR